MSKQDEILIGDLTFDVRSLDLHDSQGRRVELRHKSSEVLAALANRPHEIVTKAEIMTSVWPDVAVSDESLTQCIADIRRTINDKDQTILSTHVGKGYSLQAAAVRHGPVQSLRVGGLFAVIALLITAVVIWTAWVTDEVDGPTRIAVLAFDDLSAGDDAGYMGDGIAEGIITELARYPELAVIARNSSFSFRDTPTDITDIAEKLRADFVVEGSMQKSGNRLKTTVQLINARDGTHEWAHEFDAELDDYFEVQSKIVLGVASHLGRQLAWLEPETGGSQRVSALHLYLRGNTEFKKRTRDSTRAARDLYLQAIEADPDAPYGHVGMAMVVWSVLPQPWLYEDMSREDLLQMGIKHAEQAIEADQNYYAAHIARGDMHDRAGEHELAIERYRHAAKLNPSSADAMALSAEPLLFLGREDEAISVLERAIDINPVTPEWYYKSMAFAYWAANKCEEAVKWMKKRSSFRPWDLRHLMVGQACAGDLEGARETARKHAEAEPEYSVRTYRERNTKSFQHNPELLDRFTADLLKAGMPPE